MENPIEFLVIEGLGVKCNITFKNSKRKKDVIKKICYQYSQHMIH